MWTRLTDLDPDPVLLAALAEAQSHHVIGSFRGLARTLQLGGDSRGAERMRIVAESAPQVLATPHGVQWVRSLLRAIESGSSALYVTAMDQFSPFEMAAAISSATTWAGRVPGGWTSVPGIRAAIATDGDSFVEVANGLSSVPLVCLPSCGAIDIDPFDSGLRAVAADVYEPSGADGLDAYAQELHAAAHIASTVSPTMMARFRTTIVPILSPPGIASAATHEAAPWVTYCSFGREGSDLVAALAHEELHATLNAVDAVFGEKLPAGAGVMDVPWREGRRPLPAVLHGLAAFGRAATVRRRAAVAGRDSSGNAAALDREVSWVRAASARVLAGALGPLDHHTAAWVERNEAAMTSTAPPWPRPDLSLAAQSGPGACSRWWLLRGGLANDAAAEAAGALSAARWPRATGSFRDQDQVELSSATLFGPASMELLGRAVPRLMHESTGMTLTLTAAKAHRLRQGDSIRPHSDAGQDLFRFRAVLGVTAKSLLGGQIRFLDMSETPVFAVQPAFGHVLIFEITDTARHEVTVLDEPYFRLTAVASYRAR